MTTEAKHRKGDPVTPKRFSIKPRQLLIGALAAGLLTSAGFAIASQIDIPDVENGAGVIATPNCFEDTAVNFTYTTATGGATTVTGVTVTGISSDCSGSFISLKILNYWFYRGRNYLEPVPHRRRYVNYPEGQWLVDIWFQFQLGRCFHGLAVFPNQP